MDASEKQLARIYSILDNAHMTTSDRILLIRLEREYPVLLQGVQAKILVGKLARDTGISMSASSRFLAAMNAVRAIDYQVKKSHVVVRDDGKSSLMWEAESYVTENELCILSPYMINIVGTPKRERNRKLVLARSQLARSCSACGSSDIVYAVEPICRSCGWRMPLEIVELEDLK